MDEILAGVSDACSDILTAAMNRIHNDTLEPSESPTCVLGRMYNSLTEMDKIKKDYISRVWVTYRKNFQPIMSNKGGELACTGYTSDSGWGCTLRCAQMVFAEAILRKHFGRDFNWEKDQDKEEYLKLLSLFEDKDEAPYSLHKMARTGENTNIKNIGEWYGPHAVAKVMRHIAHYDMWNNFSVICGIYNMFFLDEIVSEGKKSHPDRWDPIILIIPAMFGYMYKFNELYTQLLKKYLELPECIGIIGGTPSHAIYIIGYSGDNVIYLDPHTTQTAGKVGRRKSEAEKEMERTYHCHSNPRTVPIAELDSSIAVCFLITNDTEFENVLTKMSKELLDKQGQKVTEIHVTRPDYLKDESDYVPARTLKEMHQNRYEGERFAEYLQQYTEKYKRFMDQCSNVVVPVVVEESSEDVDGFDTLGT